MKNTERPVAVVTGSNTGLGKECAHGLLKAGYHVVMACRRPDACEIARRDLLSRPDSTATADQCECSTLDLNNYASIRNFCREFSQGGKQSLNLLVNNAGVLGAPFAALNSTANDHDHNNNNNKNNTTAAIAHDDNNNNASSMIDGHFKINHLGTYLLTRLLLPCMAPFGRIVTVGSESHRRSPPLHFITRNFTNKNKNKNNSTNNNDDELIVLDPGNQPKHWYPQYSRSKLGNLLMTAELSRQLKQRKSTVTAYCVSPGRVATDIFRYFGTSGNSSSSSDNNSNSDNTNDGTTTNGTTQNSLLSFVINRLTQTFFQTPQQGAQGILRACLDPGFNDKHVLYIHHSKETVPSSVAMDEKLAHDLWQYSSSAVCMNDDEDRLYWPKL